MAFALPYCSTASFAWGSSMITVSSTNYWRSLSSANHWRSLPPAPRVAPVAAIAFARTHLARLLRSAAPEPPEPLDAALAATAAPQIAEATAREHRLRPGSRRRARPRW